ncbi:MAG TPA: cellulase family glycosylhydrolase [Candidatus Acidoferrum sp.]|nr:cellulase family glycosylhydrolase [Candidatus Acidoferrum sp.]
MKTINLSGKVARQRAITNSFCYSPASVNRRAVLKSLGLAAAGAILPTGLSGGTPLASTPQTKERHNNANAAKNPSWYGFNLLEYFSTDPDWMKYFPYKDDGLFLEDDFRWIRDWGFNWVRLPMDYRFWTDPADLLKIKEEKVAPIDRAIRLGEKYGVHVNICLHRAPGYCILDDLNEALTGIHITKENTSVYSDPKTLDAFVYQWTYFADRYKGISSDKLSFNLVNEPIVMPTAVETEELRKAGKTSQEIFSEIGHRHAGDYTRVARAAIEGIRKHDPQRLIVTDGYNGGTAVIPDLFDSGVLQSCHTYHPVQLTHYQCEWARGFLTGSEPLPTWPLKRDKGEIIDRAQVAHTFQPWGELSAHGVPIHFGEMGCYKHTPPEVVLSWFDDTLGVLGDLQTGWALWNFRGPFGVLDTERPGTKYKDWHGHQLDSALLNLLQKKVKA